MSALLQTLRNSVYYIWNQIISMSFADILDIVLVSIIVYYAYGFVRQRRAGKLALGLLTAFLALWISDFVGLNAIHYILENLFGVGLIAIIVIFQPELRSALEKMGGNFRSLNRITELQEGETKKMIDELCTAVTELSASNTGALIVLERNTRLGDELKTGTRIDAEVSSLLIRNIFVNKSPLHDGAMIFRGNRILSCGCHLPSTDNPNLPPELGARHRAAIGASENSDAFIIVVSEETGDVSIARNGSLDRGVSVKALRHRLMNEYHLNREKKKKGAKKNEDPSVVD